MGEREDMFVVKTAMLVVKEMVFRLYESVKEELQSCSNLVVTFLIHLKNVRQYSKTIAMVSCEVIKSDVSRPQL